MTSPTGERSPNWPIIQTEPKASLNSHVALAENIAPLALFTTHDEKHEDLGKTERKFVTHPNDSKISRVLQATRPLFTDEETLSPAPSLSAKRKIEESSSEKSLAESLTQEEIGGLPLPEFKSSRTPKNRSPLASFLISSSKDSEKIPALKLFSKQTVFTPPEDGARAVSRGRRRNGPVVTKEAQIIDGHLHIEGQPYPVIRIKNGNYHFIYKFEKPGTLIYKEQCIDLQSVILRTRNPTCSVKDVKDLVENDAKAVAYCHENGIPLPTYYLCPQDFIDSQNIKNGNFWLIEKMEKEVSTADWEEGQPFDSLSSQNRKVLDFVRFWLEKSFAEKRDVINDFFPRNVMWDREGNLKIVDPSLPEELWQLNLKNYITAWSANNDEVRKFLVANIQLEDMP
ncbi:hypothetical protein PHSC3_000999 [Chlamydiales bacterium STE3]|nr:hypothetical protein PHSC3_000999 [Chlamydiales bacterium STE3]